MKRTKLICLPILFLLLLCAEATENKNTRLILKLQPAQKEFLGNVFIWDYKIENFDDKNKALIVKFRLMEKGASSVNDCSESCLRLPPAKEGKLLFGFIENISPPVFHMPEQEKTAPLPRYIIIQYGSELSYTRSLIPISIPGAIGVVRNLNLEFKKEKVLVNFDVPYTSKSDKNTFLYKTCGAPEYKTGKNRILCIELLNSFPELKNIPLERQKANIKFNLEPDSGLITIKNISDLKALLKSAMENRDKAMEKYKAGRLPLEELNKYQVELIRVQKAIDIKKRQ